MDRIEEIRNRIEPLYQGPMEEARRRQDSLAKPPGSLGLLEDVSVRLAGITGQVKNRVEKGCIAIFCADNGVAEEGVSSAPTTVTAAQTMNFTRRLTGVGALAECFGSELLIVDMGVKDPIYQELYDESGIPLKDTHKIIDRRISAGTANLAKGPAMSRKDAIKCILTGIEMADAIKEAGFDCMGVGEMGIGNTTTGTAVLSAITGISAATITGRGGGLTDRDYNKKMMVIDNAVTMWNDQRQPGDDPLVETVDLLATLGGYDICAMAGAYIGAAANRMPVVIDGLISVVAALAASRLAPGAADYMFASHRSAEPGYDAAIRALGLTPFLDLGMRLGEGSGCPLAFQVLRAACAVMDDMATFEEAAINDDYLEEIRKGGCF